MISKLTVALFLLAVSGFAQEHTVTVVATSLVITPYQMTNTSAGHSYTNCSGNTSTFGNFGNISVNCSSTEKPPTETSTTHHIYTYYTVIRDSENSYLLSCTRRMVWDRCPTVIAGQNFTFSLKGSKVFLTDSQKIHKFDLVQSVPLPIADERPKTATVDAREPKHEPVALVPIHVSCNVEGADITVDGDFVGTAPSDLRLSPGKHQIIVSKSGFTPWQRQLSVSNGEINILADLHASEN